MKVFLNFIIISILLGFAMLVAPSVAAKEPEWHMINVNHISPGDAHLLIDNNVNILIDVGDFDQAEKYLVPYLRNLNITTVQHLFITHPHTDHYGGIDALINADIHVDNIYYNLPPIGTDDWNYKRNEFLSKISKLSVLGTKYFDISKGYVLKTMFSKLKVLFAQKGIELNDSRLSINDLSMIIQWDVMDFRVLFTGDLDFTIGTELAKHSYFQADILKVPHHGLIPIAPNSFFDTVSPSLLMFSSTKAFWNHPRARQAKIWTENNDVLYCHNGLNGNVVLTFSSKTVTLKNDNPSTDCPIGALDISPQQKINQFTLTGVNLLLLQ